MGAFRQYTPYTGLYGSEAPEVKLVRNLNGPARQLPLHDVVEAVQYVNKIIVGCDDSRSCQGAQQSLGEMLNGNGYQVSQEDRETLLSSPLFDAAWYAINHDDIDESSLSPVDHYLLVGGRRGYEPGPDFDSRRYLADNPDVAASGVNPLLHYIRYGQREGRSVHASIRPADIDSAIRGSTSDVENGLRLSTVMDNEPVFAYSEQEVAAELPRTFAFYLPQFHPIAENDWAHGKGFTEWNNVIKAKPLFKGHYQPRIPGELGYYDLRAFDVMRDQVQLALEHGITGFCFYYYYFNGKKLLHRPIENYVKSDLKAPFFLLWANENWSKRWDGGDKEVIIAQQHSRKDDVSFIQELFPLFEDDRYTKIGGKPVLMIYKAHLFPNVLATVEIWREEAARRGLPGLYLIMVDDWTPEPIQPRSLGFDASYEIPSNLIPAEVLADDAESLGLDESFAGSIVDYQKFAQFHMSRPMPEYRRFRTVMLPWDNTPRYGSRAIVHINTIGEGYKLWLSRAMLDTYNRYPAEERIVFLHSWNEWCEGTYLEPDGRLGRRYLQQTKQAINDVKTVLSLGTRSEVARALSLLRHSQTQKDEVAFRMLQAAHWKSAALLRDNETLRSQVASLGSELASLASRQGWNVSANGFGPGQGLQRSILTKLLLRLAGNN
jgi:hypothetical protein